MLHVHGNIRLLILILLLLGNQTLLAAPQTEQQVTTATETWLQQGLTENRPGATVVRLEPHVADGRTAAYIAHLREGGYCLVGADDVLLPVYFYAPEGEFDPQNEELQNILASIAGRLQWIEERQAPGDLRLDPFRQELDSRAQEWRDLAAGRAVRRDPVNRDVPVLMRLPLNSEWFQGSPFNQDCPTTPDGGQAIVGCVATAMAQVMYYWQWPPTGTSNHSVDYHYRHTDDWVGTPLADNPGIAHWIYTDRLSWTSMDGGYLQMNGSWDQSLYNKAVSDFEATPGFTAALQALYSQLTPDSSHHFANFAATNYNFQDMTDAPTDPNSPAAQAAAQLSYHAGVSVNMNWGLNSSGAQTSLSAVAYENYFRYDPDAVYTSLDMDQIREEIHWQRVVQVRGGAAIGGHSWVISGYDNGTPGESYFWMNLGWGASDIGWYRFDTVPNGFVFDHFQITGIAPADVVRFMGATFVDPGADGTPSNPYNDPEYSQIEMPDGGTLIIKTGFDVLWNGGGVMSKPMIVKGIGSTISYAP